MRPRAQLLLAASLVVAAACNIENDGDDPPEGTLYFPNGLEVLREQPGAPARYLLVSNSNFDLRYNAGTLQAYDLEGLADAVAECVADDPRTPCTLETDRFLADEIRIASFANGLAVSPDGSRAYVVSRTAKSLTIAQLDASSDRDVFGCGGSVRGCVTEAELGVDAESGKPIREWVGDPVAVLSRPMTDWLPDRDDLKDYVVVAHLDGQLSLFTHPLDDDGEARDEMVLADVYEAPYSQPTSLAFDESTGLLHSSFAPPVLLNSGKIISRAAVSFPDRTIDGVVVPDIGRARIFGEGGLVLEGVGPRTDTRDIAFVEHGAPEAEGRALILGRDPNALLLADLDETRNRAGVGRVLRTTVLGTGPARLVVSELEREGAEPLRLVLATCFNSREIFVVDLDSMMIRTVVPNLSGPFDLAVDSARRLLYVTDFRSSVIRIVDLSPLVDPEAAEGARLVATLGSPRIIQELQ